MAVTQRVADTSRPWLDFYGDVPSTLEYPRVTLHEAAMTTVQRVPTCVS